MKDVRSAHVFDLKLLITYMKKFLDCHWLRGMQFLGNTVQKKSN